MKDRAMDSMIDIVRRADFQHIYISYNTDGIINYKEFGKALENIGTVEYYLKPFRRYKSNSNGEDKGKLKEIIIYVRK